MEQIDLAPIEENNKLFDDERVTKKRTNHQLRQESKLKGEVREFTIFNDTQCDQSVQSKHGVNQKFRADLTYLHSQFKRSVILADSWLITALIGALVSFLLVYAGWFSNMQFSKGLLYSMTIFSFSFCIIAFLFTLLRSHDHIVFYSRHGHTPVLRLINKNPNTTIFKAFIKTLSQHISLAQKKSNLSTTEQLKLELKELRRLKNEAAISDEQYEKAKKLILKNSAFL